MALLTWGRSLVRVSDVAYITLSGLMCQQRLGSPVKAATKSNMATFAAANSDLVLHLATAASLVLVGREMTSG